MLIPIYLGICRAADAGLEHAAAALLMGNDLRVALIVSIVHTLTMIAAGGSVAWLVFRHLGLKVLSHSWFNLDGAWALSLIVVGMASLGLNLVRPG
jgi:hypothetical protein